MKRDREHHGFGTKQMQEPSSRQAFRGGRDTRAAGVLGRHSSLDAGRRSLGGPALSKEHPCRKQRIALEAKMLF